MALKLKYTDEHGILHINMSPSSTPSIPPAPPIDADAEKTELSDPKFDTINNRFGQYDLFGGKYDVEIGGEKSLFRSRYNSIEEELANTPYAFTAERPARLDSSPLLDITIDQRVASASPSKDIEDDRYFNRKYDLFGPAIDFEVTTKTSDEEETPAFTVTQLIHAQDRYFDLSSRHSVVDSPVVGNKGESVRRTNFQVRSEPGSARQRTVRIVDVVEDEEAFHVLQADVKAVEQIQAVSVARTTALPASRRKETSFAVLGETPSRPTSPHSLPNIDTHGRTRRVSPFKGRGFRNETSRHTTPKTSAANSRASSPPPILRRRTNSLSRIDKMAAVLQPQIQPVHTLSRPHSPRNFLKENIEDVREMSELNRELHEAEAERKRKEEEEALLQEMAMFDKPVSDAIRSVVCSRTASRSNSPNKLKIRSRSHSPAVSPTAIVSYENILDKRAFVNPDDGMPKPVTHNSRVRSVSKSQPQSNDGSPKISKIPKRQNSVSPSRKRDPSKTRVVENNLSKNQRFISNSTSSIHDSVRINGVDPNRSNDKKGMSKSTQLLNIAPTLIKGKPPISPGRSGPPPSNKSINAKRLSPIVGTPSKSPVDDKPSPSRTPTKQSPVAKKPVANSNNKTTGNTSATSRLNSRQPSSNGSVEQSPDKRRIATKQPNATSKSEGNAKKTLLATSRLVARAASTRAPQKPAVTTRQDSKKSIARTNSMKSLQRTPSTKTLNEKPPLKKKDSKMSMKSTSTGKLDEVDEKTSLKSDKKSPTNSEKDKQALSKEKEKVKEKTPEKVEPKEEPKSARTNNPEVTTQDNETQYDKMTNAKGELVIMTKKSVVSMTTAAITAQPLEVVTTVTNQLPAAFEKAREKGMFERHNSKDTLSFKVEEKEVKAEINEPPKEKIEEEKTEDKKAKVPSKPEKATDESVKLRPLLPPYDNPQVEKVKQKIDDILKSPEVSTENIIAVAAKEKQTKSSFRSLATKSRGEVKPKEDTAHKMASLMKQAAAENKKNELKTPEAKTDEKTTNDIREEASKIVDSIITPVEEHKIEKTVPEKTKEVVKETVEPTRIEVKEKKDESKSEIVEKTTETLTLKGEPEVEVQSSNVSTPGFDKIKMVDSSASEKSHSNGRFPQSTSTTPKPPARTRKEAKDSPKKSDDSKEQTPDSTKKPNLCSRLMGKCKSKCCPCCIKGEDDERERDPKEMEATPVEEKKGMMSKLNCCKKKEEIEERVSEVERVAERAAGKASIEFENETKRKRKLRDVLCACCSRRRRVSDVSVAPLGVAGDVSGEVGETGCCGRRREPERRDSILSDRPAQTCCNNRLFSWLGGACRRKQTDVSASRRQSMFSKNKSLSPTIPPVEDNRVKLDSSLVEHTSVMRGAIPVLPAYLAYFCLFCNVIVPGLGTILSGMFCLCFGIPRFGVHDGAKQRIGSFMINLLVGCGQLFTVVFCLVGWGWSIWWGVIMVKTARKYKKLKAEEAMMEAESAPPVTANNHTQA